MRSSFSTDSCPKLPLNASSEIRCTNLFTTELGAVEMFGSKICKCLESSCDSTES